MKLRGERAMRIIGIGALLVVITSAALIAGDEPKPDFSGTWVFNTDKSRLEKQAPAESVFWIEHHGPGFKLTRTHTWSDDRWDTLSFEATTDAEETYKETGGFETWTRLYWLGEELVLDMKMAYQGERGTNVVHYRLADEGRTFIAAEWYHMPRRKHHNLWVFDRASDAWTENGKDRVRKLAERYTAAWGSRDPESVAAFFAEDGSLTVNDDEPAVGREAIAGVARSFMTDLPDMVLFFDGLEGRGDRARFYWTLDATNSGPGGTGNRVRVSGHETWRFDEDGLILESQGEFPEEEYERQLEVGYGGPPLPGEDPESS
jgi:nuclear transport factor 2 (NTF2) superfamily protein